MFDMRLLIVLSILSGWGNALSQPGFNLPYDFARVGAAFENILLYKDTLVMHGTIFSETIPYKSGGMIAWADTNGNILKSRFYFDSLGRDFLYFYGEPFIRLSDGSGYLLSVNVRKNGALMKVNHNGDVVSLTEYVDNTSITDFYRQIIEVEDGFYVLGSKQRTWDYLSDVFIMKLDKNGKKVWEKSFDEPLYNLGVSSFLKLNNNSYVLGFGVSPSSTQPMEQNRYWGKILFTDSLMNVQRKWESIPSLEHGGIKDLRRLDNGNWVYLTDRVEVYPLEKYRVRQPKAIVRDANFNLISERVMGMPSGTLNNLYFTSPSPDGNYVSSGQMAVNGDRPALAGWVYKMTPEGDSIWSVLDTLFYVEGGYVEHYLTGTVVLPGGSTIVCGTVDAYKDNVGKSWAWLLKVSKDGCVEASNCVPVSDLESPENKDGFIVYPNPANTFLHFNDPNQTQWEAIEIVDISGKTVLRMNAPSDNRMDVGALTNGIYFVKFIKSNKYINKKINIIK